MRRIALHTLVCLGLAFSAGSVVTFDAVPAAAQTEEEVERAKQRFRDGKKAYDDEDYTTAAAAFLEAYELSGRAELLYNVGQSHRLAGNLRDAERFLQRYLEEAPDASNADAVVETIVELQQQIAASLATVQIETEVDGRDVFVDGELEPRCQTPCAVTVAPGPRTIILKGDGATDTAEEVTLEPGQTFQLKTQLSPAIATGFLMLSTDRPGGTLRVAGQEQGLPLQRPLELESGDYSVTVESARNTKWTGQIRVEANETTELLVPMDSLVEARKRGSLRKSLAYGLWGVSAAAAVGGTLMAMQTRASYDALVAQRATDGAVDADLRAQGANQQFAANLMFGVATGAVVTGIALFVWDEFAGEKDPTPQRPRPTEDVAQAD